MEHGSTGAIHGQLFLGREVVLRLGPRQVEPVQGLAQLVQVASQLVDALVARLVAHGFLRRVHLLCLFGQSVHHGVDGLALAPHVLFTVGHEVWVLPDLVQSGTVPTSDPTETS